MKVLVSGGMLTENIIKGIKKNFESTGVEFNVVPFIEDIESIYSRGEYFDRAIIIEQSWTADYQDNDEMSWRNKINNFAQSCRARLRPGMSFVFLAQTNEQGAVAYEEIFDIQEYSVVVVKAPKYKASFFTSLINCDLSDFPPEIVYTIEDDPGYSPETDYTPDYTSEESYPEESDSINHTSGDIPDWTGDTSWDGDNTGWDNQPEELGSPDDWPDDLTDGKDWTDDFGGDDFGGDDFGGDLGGNDLGVPVDDFGDENHTENNWDNPPEDNWGNQQYGDEPYYGTEQQGYKDETTEEQRVKINFNKDDGKAYEGNDVEEQYPDESIPIAGGADSYSEDFYNNSPYDDGHYNDDNYGGDSYGEVDPYSNDPYGDYDPGYVQSQQQSNQDLNDDPYRYENDYSRENDDRSGYYDTKEEVERVNMSDDQVRAALQAFASRGNSIVVTGCGGCGTSTIAFNLANTLCNLGYSVLLVDMDTMGRTQSYISKDNYDSMDADGANLIAGVNSSTGINAHMAVVRQGFHLLSMGIGGDLAEPDKLIHKQKLMRFTSAAKNGHNFVIYDIPFKYATDFFSEVLYMCDNIVLTIDASNWGVTKTMINMCNVQSDEMRDTLFNRAQIVFNRFRGNNRYFGKKVKNIKNVAKEMDNKVAELIGEDPEYYFKDMHLAGVINEDIEFESGWYARKHFSDTRKGQPIFIDLVKRIVLKI